ncbi:MAG: DUF4192 family protein [Vitreimonas sp.]
MIDISAPERDAILRDLDGAANDAANSGRWDEAERLWREMRRRAPDNRNALWGLGFSALQRGDAAEARALLLAAHDAEPQDKLVLLTLATACKACLDDNAEASALNALLALDSDYLPGLLAKGAMLERQVHSDAPMVYQRALEVAQREPDSAQKFGVQLALARAAVEGKQTDPVDAFPGSASGSTMQDGATASAPITSYQGASRADRHFWIGRTEQMMRGKLSDVGRWENAVNHQSGWHSRGSALARFIKAGESVFEFGSGHSALRTALPYDCPYQASDLAPLTADVLAFDLNAPALPPILGYQVAAFSGVLEYVHDLPRTARFLATNFETVVCSYATLRSATSEEYAQRRYDGWFTDLSAAAFAALFERAGFVEKARRLWNDQLLFRFEKADEVTAKGFV